MGGGDLNLKKSWHPSTLRNIERVWKAEQKHEVEKQKIEQLQKELAEERAREEIQTYAEDQGVIKKREERLDWMYQGPAAMVNREDYLLGRKIDKTLEILEHKDSGSEPKNEDFDIEATMFSSQDLSGTATVDLANKIREDPLFSIMKKEKEQRKNLLTNPVKMKQLQQMLQQSLGKGKKKKSKKRHSDSNIDEKHHKKHKKSRNSESHLSEDDEPYTKISRDHHRKNKNTSLDEDEYEDKYRRKRSPTRTYQNKYDNSPSRNRVHGHSSTNVNRHHSENMYSRSHRDKKPDNAIKKKMDDKERERRLKEMQENAKWREEQRERKVRRYREDDSREERCSKMDASDFIKPMLSRAAGKGSLENRVKQKIFSIQRGSGDMDKHFAKR